MNEKTGRISRGSGRGRDLFNLPRPPRTPARTMCSDHQQAVSKPTGPKWQYLFLATTAAMAVALLFVTSSSSDITRLDRRNLNALLTPPDLLEPPPHISPRRHDYPLASILNVRSFTSLRRRHPLDHRRIAQESSARPRSILALYTDHPPSQCVTTPSLSRLRRAAAAYFRAHHKHEHPDTNDATLVIHHDPAKLDLPFVRAAASLAKSFSRVRLLVPDRRLQKRLVGSRVIMHHDSTDDTIAFMAAAAHLLVHTGETSALGGLLTTGTVYHTAALSPYTSQNAFKWLLRHRVPLSAEKVSPYTPSLNFMGRVRPTCCDLQPFGTGDEEKIVCGNTADFQPPCWVLAVGSAGLFGFERDVLNKTLCHVHTFDCTGDWKVPRDLSDRVTLHKLCLGEKNEGLFRTWDQLIKIGSEALPGATNLTMPAFAKMDIEGYEFAVIRALVEGSDEVLPQQIAMEVHQNTIMPVGPPYIPVEPGSERSYVTDETIGELFQNLSRKGYDLVYRADNPFCSLCSEVTVVRRSALPAE